MLRQLKDIRKLMDEASSDELLQRRLGQSLNIQGVPAHKQGKGLDFLGLTVRICAVEGFHIVHFPDLRGAAADRTDLRDILHAASGLVFGDLGDDHVGLIDLDGIPDSQLQSPHDADVVDAGAADRGSLQLHRLEDSHWVNQSGPGGTPFDLRKRRLPDLVGPFEGHGIAGELGGSAQGLAIGNVVVEGHQTVGGILVGLDMLRKPVHAFRQGISGHHFIFYHVEALGLQPQKLLLSRVFKIHALSPHQRKRKEVYIPLRGDLVI